LRLSKKQRQFVMDRFNVDRLWSYSRFSTYLEQPWEYRLAYLEKVPRGENIYTYWGTIAHDIIQDFYDGKHEYSDMIGILEEKIMDWKLERQDLKFMSSNVESGYIDNLKDYFTTTEVIKHEIRNETPVCIHFKDEERDRDIVFIGYADSEYTDENGITHIVDYKTSSKTGFSGASLKAHARQLMLYAIGFHQVRGIPYDKINLRFDMMKYYEVGYQQKNGKIGKSKQERRSWVAGSIKKIRKDLMELGYDPIEVDEMCEEAILENNISNMPQEVQDKFTLNNCYIDVSITEEEANQLEKFVVDVVDEILRKEEMDWEEAFPAPIIDASNSFYFEQLAPHLLQYHKEYQNKQSLMKKAKESSLTDDDLLAMFE